MDNINQMLWEFEKQFGIYLVGTSINYEIKKTLQYHQFKMIRRTRRSRSAQPAVEVAPRLVAQRPAMFMIFPQKSKGFSLPQAQSSSLLRRDDCVERGAFLFPLRWTLLGPVDWTIDFLNQRLFQRAHSAHSGGTSQPLSSFTASLDLWWWMDAVWNTQQLSAVWKIVGSSPV